MAFSDRELTCRDCGSKFVFTGGEQEFYASKGLQNDPVRCPSCRAQRKMMRPEDREESPNYGVFVSWGGRTPRQLHVATCAECAQVTEVPFVPRGDRPVYCSDCYRDIQSRQQAQEEAESEAITARLVAHSGGGGGTDRAQFEGAGPAPREDTAAVETVETVDAVDAVEAAETTDVAETTEPAEAVATTESTDTAETEQPAAIPEL